MFFTPSGDTSRTVVARLREKVKSYSKSLEEIKIERHDLAERRKVAEQEVTAKEAEHQRCKSHQELSSPFCGMAHSVAHAVTFESDPFAAATIALAKRRQSITGANSGTHPLDAKSGNFYHVPSEENKDDEFLAQFGGDKVMRPLHTLPCVAERPSGKPSFQSDLARALTLPHIYDEMSERKSGLKCDVGSVTVI